MPAYAIANIQSITIGPAIAEYLKRIDATLAPYQGRFLVHGDPADVREGHFVGDLIVIEFPDHNHAASWDQSAALHSDRSASHREHRGLGDPDRRRTKRPSRHRHPQPGSKHRLTE